MGGWLGGERVAVARERKKEKRGEEKALVGGDSAD